jgi:hypothetical protein
MRDDTKRWDAPGPLSFMSKGLEVAEIAGLTQHFVSGTGVLARFADDLVGWPDVATSDSYALSLRRDRVLLVGPIDLEPGYHSAAGLAVSDVSDAFTVLEINGPGALTNLQRGAELRLDHPSRSVTRQLFGIEVFLYRAGDETRFRLHVPRGSAQAMIRHLGSYSARPQT